jgi:hypothetical protein
MSVARWAQVCWAAMAWQRAASCSVLGPGEQVVDPVGEGCWRGDVDQVGAQCAQGGQVGGTCPDTALQGFVAELARKPAGSRTGWRAGSTGRSRYSPPARPIADSYVSEAPARLFASRAGWHTHDIQETFGGISKEANADTGSS